MIVLRLPQSWPFAGKCKNTRHLRRYHRDDIMKSRREGIDIGNMKNRRHGIQSTHIRNRERRLDCSKQSR
jgi:hypothetical protein